jgi:ATP-dependent DNA ligase
MVRKNEGVTSRRGTDYSDRFPEIIAGLLTLPDAVLDAELVMLDEDRTHAGNFSIVVRRERSGDEDTADRRKSSGATCPRARDVRRHV